MNESEQIISGFLNEKGFIVSTYSKDEQRIKNNKTPDFKVYKEQQLIFYCEVKDIREDNRNYDNGGLKDNTYDIVSDCIHESYRQFLSVNKSHNVPNVLAICSKRHGIDFWDYKFTCEGGYKNNEGKFVPALKKVSEGRIKSEKTFIDLCIWYDYLKDVYSYMLYAKTKFFDPLRQYFSNEE